MGHADRSCYDLKMHGKATNTNVTATQRLDAPVVVEAVKIEPNKKILGRKFKKDQKAVTSALMELAENESKLILFEKELEKNGSNLVLTVNHSRTPVSKQNEKTI